MMNSHYKIADENKELFNSICEKYSGGSCILDICYGEVTDQLFTDKDRSLPHSNDDSHTLESVSTTSIDDMTLAIEIQKKFLRSSEPEQAQLRKSLSRIQSQSILRNEKLVVDDNIFHEYLNKASNMNSDVFKVFAKIILLSKVNEDREYMIIRDENFHCSKYHKSVLFVCYLTNNFGVLEALLSF